ncbi:MAG: hypothetical protein NT116_05060 [Candidatus Parcubacteria bacterium]|nr:hypothetical protein [Candidatus Parcubacteria bacterium]
MEIQNPDKPVYRQFDAQDQEAINELRAKFGAGSKEVEDYIKIAEKEETKKEIGLGGREKESKKGKLLALIDKVLKSINSVNLIKANKNDEKILNGQKVKVRELVEECLKSAQAYTALVEELNFVVTGARKISDTKVYQEKVGPSDFRRKQAHEALMGNINIVLRYINEHFAVYSEEILEEVEGEFKKRNEKFIRVKRVKFPYNVFLPEKFNIKNREDMGKWAVLIAEELVKYRQALS